MLCQNQFVAVDTRLHGVAAAEAVGKTHAQAEELAFDIVTGRADAADVARFDVAGGAAGVASVAASSVASTKKEA